MVCATLVTGGLTAVGGASATPTTSDCGTATPSAAISVPISSFATLQQDIQTQYHNYAESPVTYYLKTNLTDTGVSGGLDVDGELPVTIDLNGCALSITSPGAGTPAITLENGGTLTVEDGSSAGDGNLTVDGGNAAGANSGAAAGIGGIGGVGSAGADGASLTVTGGTVQATGGSARSGSPINGGGGAGIGGGGGASGYRGGASGNVTVEGGTVTVTGGTSAATGVNDAGAGAGIGGGGGGNSANGGTSSNVSLQSGAIDATGGSATATGTDSAGAGAGIGGGGGGGPTGVGGSVSSLSAYGGSVTVAGGQVNSSTGGEAAAGLGPGGSVTDHGVVGQVATNLYSGTTTLAGNFDFGINVASGATADVASGATVSLTWTGDPGTSPVSGTLNLPASSTLQVSNQTLSFSGTDTLAGSLEIAQGATLDGGGFQQRDPGPVRHGRRHTRRRPGRRTRRSHRDDADARRRHRFDQRRHDRPGRHADRSRHAGERRRLDRARLQRVRPGQRLGPERSADDHRQRL